MVHSCPITACVERGLLLSPGGLFGSAELCYQLSGSPHLLSGHGEMKMLYGKEVVGPRDTN